MSRTLSVADLGKLWGLNEDDPLVGLIKLESSAFATVRLARYRTDITSNSELYTAAAFDFRLPTDIANELPVATLLVDMVDRTIVSTLRASTEPASATLSLVFVSDPDTVVASFPMQTRVAAYDPKADAGVELGPTRILDEGWPGQTFTPDKWRAMFRR